MRLDAVATCHGWGTLRLRPGLTAFRTLNLVRCDPICPEGVRQSIEKDEWHLDRYGKA